MNISTKLFENRLNTFGEEDFLSFHYGYIRQNSPAPWRPCFSPNQHFLKELINGHPRNISTKLFENRPDTFGEEDFLSFHYFFLLVGMETRIMDGSKKFEVEEVV